METNEFVELQQVHFGSICNALFNTLNEFELLKIDLQAESTEFIRFNNAKVRQSTELDDSNLGLVYYANGRTCSASYTLSGNLEQDIQNGFRFLDTLRKCALLLPEDPYQVLPIKNKSSTKNIRGKLLTKTNLADALFTPTKNTDFTGLYSAGAIITANANSLGQQHWFSVENFNVDYSLISPTGHAVKGIYAGQQWDNSIFADTITDDRRRLTLLDHPRRKLKPGGHRCYLAPAAIAELVHILSWGGVSLAAYKQGNCGLKKLIEDKGELSSKFNLRENFELGLTPAFNENGELSKKQIPIIEAGKLNTLLVNSRSEQEYSTKHNAANSGESLRSPEILPGDLCKGDILASLDTGLWVSNLHYLNWSDRAGGRITGMTRYACMWVENGEVVGPIEDMRFDDSIFNFWGNNLHSVTDFQEIQPQTLSYGHRHLGGCKTPGMLVDNFTLTL